jgi:hypothetical protein
MWVLSLSLFAPVIMHSLGALLRRGSVSRSALYPAGREEERKKREERRVWPKVIYSPRLLYAIFSTFGLLLGLLFPSGVAGVLPSYLPAPTLGLTNSPDGMPLLYRCFTCGELKRFSPRVLWDSQWLENY